MPIHKIKNTEIFPNPKKALKDSQKQKLLLSIYIDLTEFICSSAP